MKIVRVAAFALMMAFIMSCAYLAYQSDPGRVQREIDKSPMVAPNVMHRIAMPPPCPPVCDLQKAIDKGPRVAVNHPDRVQRPCWPICDDSINQVIKAYDAKLPVKIATAQVNQAEFKHAMYTNNSLVRVR